MTKAAAPAHAQPCDGDCGILRQTLRVAALENGLVTLEGRRAAACAGCAAKAGCGAGALTEMLGGTQTLRLPQTVPLAVGERVVLAMDRRAFLGAALRAYLLPPAALVVTAGLAQSVGLSDSVTAMLCLPIFALAFLPLRRADRRGLPEASLWLEPAPEP